MIGPWAHGAFSGIFPDFNFGFQSSAGAVDLTALQLHYFDFHLKGIENGLIEEPPVRIFVMGKNEWRNENDWPLSRANIEEWFIHSDGKADSIEGTLSLEPPSNEPHDSFIYDPIKPVPTIGGPTLLQGVELGANAGPRDQRLNEKREDVLVYTSKILQEPLEVTGYLMFLLYASSSTIDTDFVVRLCDVYPDGTSRLLAEGIQRARFREGYEKELFLKKDEVAEFKINLVATSNVFMPGHKIRVDVPAVLFPALIATRILAKKLGLTELKI